MAGDDTTQLRLSSSARSSDARTIIALTSATTYRGFTNQVQSRQRSVFVNMQAGQRYYIEVLTQNASGDAHVSVAWEIPAGQGRVYESARPIEGKFLSPYVVDASVSVPASVSTQPGTRIDVPVTIRHTGADVVSQGILETSLPAGFRLPQNSQGWRSGYRYLRIIAQSEAGARGPWAAIAEVTALTTRGAAIPTSAWRVAHVSSEATQCDSGAARHAFDGDTATYWHTDYCAHTPTFPHTLTIDMGAWHPLTGLIYTPRSAMQNGNIGAYRIQVSVDGQHWVNAASGTFLDDGSAQRAPITLATPLVRVLATPIQSAVSHTVILPLIVPSQTGRAPLTVEVRALYDRSVQPWSDGALGNNRRVVTIQVQH
ncbi:MAG: discoidin domain-containing protein [Chloroflexi bacterium]|nr:discoidin domain-containing protein [Chloroflexota bacterium]